MLQKGATHTKIYIYEPNYLIEIEIEIGIAIEIEMSKAKG